MFIATREMDAPTLDVDVVLAIPERPDAVRIAAPVHLTGTVTRDRGRFRFGGRVAGQVELTCARCDRPMVLPVDETFLLVYGRQPVGTDDERHEIMLHEDDFTAAEVDAQGRIDLLALAREQLELAVPMKPLCRPDCRGLCPTCGADRNAEPCACPSAPDAGSGPLGADLRHSSH
jgi:DUF177 domain-containing protein